MYDLFINKEQDRGFLNKTKFVSKGRHITPHTNRWLITTRRHTSNPASVSSTPVEMYIYTCRGVQELLSLKVNPNEINP